jgi:phosphoglycolate phosphatase/AHBA synthesis associated protein
VLFDMDGVLVRSDEVWFLVVEASGVRFRGSPVMREEFFPTFGQGTAADVESFGLRCTALELDAFYQAEFVKHLDAVWVNPDAAPLMAALKVANLHTALVTNTVGPLASVIMQHAGLLESFSVRATPDRVREAKPAPDLLYLACREIGLAPSETWMIGDSKFDRAAARAAGVPFVGFGIDGDLRVERLADLEPLLART